MDEFRCRFFGVADGSGAVSVAGNVEAAAAGSVAGGGVLMETSPTAAEGGWALFVSVRREIICLIPTFFYGRGMSR